MSVTADVTDDVLCLAGGGIVVVTGRAMAAWCAVRGIFAEEGLFALQFVVVDVCEKKNNYFFLFSKPTM